MKRSSNLLFAVTATTKKSLSHVNSASGNLSLKTGYECEKGGFFILEQWLYHECGSFNNVLRRCTPRPRETDAICEEFLGNRDLRLWLNQFQ